MVDKELSGCGELYRRIVEGEGTFRDFEMFYYGLMADTRGPEFKLDMAKRQYANYKDRVGK